MEAGKGVTIVRPYQMAAMRAVLEAWETHRSVLIVMATGTGKSLTAGEILRERAKHGRILWLAHRSELLEQATDTLAQRISLRCELEKADRRAATRPGFLGLSPVVVASVQTLKGQRLRRWPQDAFATIVVDEAHHATAKGYREILAHFASARVLGLTATPDRGDDVGLGAVFDACAFEYDIRTAIREGYLAPIVQQSIECADLDLSDIKTVAGDLAQGELEKRLRVDAVLHQIAGPLVELAGTRPTLVFTASVASAHALVDVLAGYTQRRAVAIDGTTPAEIRAERLNAYRRGDVQFVVNCAVLTEGFDAPETACVAMARPTKSRALYAQCVGRGTRLAAGKSDCLVLDFRGNAGRHKLVSPIDVLAGKPLPEDVATRAKQLADGGRPSEAALAQAEAEAVERERRAEEKRQREAKIRAEVAYRAQQVDPFGIVGSDDSGDRASQHMLDHLARLGVDLRGHMPSASEATRLARTIADRRKRGLCTYKQARLLAKHGLNPDVGFEFAKYAIDVIAANRWQCPDSLRAEFAEVGAADAAE